MGVPGCRIRVWTGRPGMSRSVVVVEVEDGVVGVTEYGPVEVWVLDWDVLEGPDTPEGKREALSRARHVEEAWRLVDVEEAERVRVRLAKIAAQYAQDGAEGEGGDRQ